MTSEDVGNLWRATCREQVAAPPLDGERSADLVVIGGGFTGCSAALRAAELGAKVILLEAREIGHGGSGRNVGLVNAGLWLPPDDIEAAMGKEAGEDLTRILSEGPQLVFTLIEKHSIACEAVRNGTLHLAASAAGLKDLRERHRQMTARGAPVTLLSADETQQRTGSGVFHGALHDARAGTVQPLAYCRGLARAAAAAGAALHQHSPAVDVERSGESWIVRTPMGRVRAGALLLATNAYHSGSTGLSATQTVPVHYFQMATEPLPDEKRAAILPEQEGCWDTAMVMSSFRTDAMGRLIVGAVGSLGHAASGLHRAWAARYLAHLFPSLSGTRLSYAWHGRIAMTNDHIPRIQKLGRGALACFGYSGRGIAPGTTFGTKAAEALLGDDETVLPIRPVAAHHERGRNARAVYYESGSLATHATALRF